MRIWGILCLLCGLVAVDCAAPGSLPKPASKMVQNPTRAQAEQLITALAAGDANAAERDFSAELRAELPPAVLTTTWRTLLASAGALSSIRFARSDHPLGKDRHTYELDFARRKLLALVVLEPRTAQVIGLFFKHQVAAPETPPSDELADPRVLELTLGIGDDPSTRLGASLTLPKARADRRLPAVLLIAGSGPGDRDETTPHAKPFRDLAYGLAARGVAALRYDKRTYAHPETLDLSHITVEEEVLVDATSALKLLFARPEVDPRRIFVVGHSLGGLLAPEIAERAPGVAGLVLLAAPGRPVLDLVLEQLRASGATANDLAALTAKVRALPELPPTEMLFGAPALYWRALARRDEPGVALRLGLPVLYLRGGLDRNVLAVDEENWARALSGHVPFEQATLPGLDHLLLPGGDASAQVHVPEDVSVRIAAFIERAP